MHEQRKTKQKDDEKTPKGAVPAYLLDREGQTRAKVLSNMIKQKRKEKAVSPGRVAPPPSPSPPFADLTPPISSFRASGRCRSPRCEPRARRRF